MTIQDFVLKYAERGECKCGRCLDVGTKPDPAGHTANLIFFKIAKKDGATAEEMLKLTKECAGEFTQIDPFDGADHNYMEIGAWIGSQDLGLQFMGLACLLGLAELLTPITVFGMNSADEQADVMKMAENGLLSIMSKKKVPA